MKCELTYCQEDAAPGHLKCRPHWILYGVGSPPPIKPPRPTPPITRASPTPDRQGSGHARRVERKYGLAAGEYQERLESQDGTCAICDKPCQTGRRLAVDHDHQTGKIRGLLCGKCNVGLGYFADYPARLEAAAEYLRRFTR